MKKICRNKGYCVFKKIYFCSVKINKDNSSMSVNCVAKRKCMHRHTELCKQCANNIELKDEYDCYISK